MKEALVSQEDLTKYSDILQERPVSNKKINRWWREMVEKHSLDPEHEWSINFGQCKFIGREIPIPSSDR